MTDYASRDAELRTVSDPVWRILTGAAAFGAGVFVCGAVGSYTPTDPSWNAATGADIQKAHIAKTVALARYVSNRLDSLDDT